MSSNTYSTRTECIDSEIVSVIEAGGNANAEDYNIDAIADTLVVMDSDGINPVYHVDADESEFWATVEKYDYAAIA